MTIGLYSLEIESLKFIDLNLTAPDYTTVNELTMDRGPATAMFISRHDDINSDIKSYEVSFGIEDNRIYDGRTCTDYAKWNSNYDECVTDSFRKQLVKTYGCQNLPPFLDIKCNSPTQDIQDPDPILLEKTFADLDKLSDGLKIDAMKDCLYPCQRNCFITSFLQICF